MKKKMWDIYTVRSTDEEKGLAAQSGGTFLRDYRAFPR
jgi:hypothetical protein